jgi:hypothetical protein
MTIKIQLEDCHGTGNTARVTKYGQLIVAPIDFSTAVATKLEVANTAYNFVVPKQDKIIVITDILLYANRNVGANDATVDIYTSDVGPTETTIKESIIQTEMLKQTSRDLTGLNLEVSQGRWVNAKTDDDDVFVTIGYYYVPILKDEN